jgi:hypothetical protein
VRESLVGFGRCRHGRAPTPLWERSHTLSRALWAVNTPSKRPSRSPSHPASATPLTTSIGVRNIRMANSLLRQ